MLHIENSTRNSIIVDSGRVADNHWTRFIGLIGVKELSTGDGLLIDPCKGVHCMFMSIPIDVLYVDRENIVIGVDRMMKPWRIGKIYRAGSYVVELPAGTIDQTKTQIGDQLLVRSTENTV